MALVLVFWRSLVICPALDSDLLGLLDVLSWRRFVLVRPPPAVAALFSTVTEFVCSAGNGAIRLASVRVDFVYGM